RQVLRETARLAEGMLAGGWVEDAGGLRVLHCSAVSECPDGVRLLNAQRVVDEDAAALIERDAELRKQEACPDACRPHERACRDPHPVREHGLAAVIRLECGSDMDLDASTLEPARRVLPELARDLREDLRRRADEHPALWCLAEPGVGAERLTRHVVQLGERLDSSVTRAHEHEAELGRIVGMDRGALELQQDAV